MAALSAFAREAAAADLGALAALALNSTAGSDCSWTPPGFCFCHSSIGTSSCFCSSFGAKLWSRIRFILYIQIFENNQL